MQEEACNDIKFLGPNQERIRLENRNPNIDDQIYEQHNNQFSIQEDKIYGRAKIAFHRDRD